ncbi:hypothetical protein IFR05_009209 [Cadophora sp. M221]|nr:hypothetical protein IFR05_009209 [Cadophora sp. M221]
MIIRKQQEASFKQMDSGRWIPREDSKVMGDLSRIRRDVKNWAKVIAIKDMSKIQQLGISDKDDLMKALAHVVILEDGELPQGLSTHKSSSILLNALLAHDIFAKFFHSPFFFLQRDFGYNSENFSAANELSDLYRMLQESNQEDAHLWRSKTLRLLLPLSRLGNHDEERVMRSWTESRIAEVSSQAASRFAAGPARHFMAVDAGDRTNYRTKLESIYQEAATISVNLWTRRTFMKCTTLEEMRSPIFDPDSPHLVAHSIIHPDDHEGRLKGQPISVIVHPLLEVLGTDEAKDYDQARVWATAEVWFAVENQM